MRPDFRSFANPIKLDGKRLPAKSAPSLGADTDAVLTELGYPPTELDALRKRGIT
jgi:crotonobetainyl-CoA:carnitine CoA-transferase CaiB-like acyl-CoA transferase